MHLGTSDSSKKNRQWGQCTSITHSQSHTRHPACDINSPKFTPLFNSFGGYAKCIMISPLFPHPTLSAPERISTDALRARSLDLGYDSSESQEAKETHGIVLRGSVSILAACHPETRDSLYR